MSAIDTAACSTATATPAGWQARLALGFEREPTRTVLARREHHGPLRVQKALYPEGPEVCQAIIVHPPGGIVGGDTLELAIDAGSGTSVQVTTPGATKWYRSAGATALATTRIRAAPGSCVEWLPQEAIVFDAARANIATRIDLDGDAVFVGWDIVSLGRAAAGERFTRGRLRQTFELAREGRLLWCERALLEGGSPALQSGAVLGGAPVFGTLVAAAGALDDATLAACRDLRPARGEGTITRLPEVVVARYRGDSAATARMYLASTWRLLRPRLCGREAVFPRIWAT
jgi:urease accessory protein